MCKGQEFCYVLGKDPSSWSSECPLPPPDYFEQSVDLFEKAIEALLKGDKTQALIELQKSESEKVKEFFVEHGQQSAYFRVQNRKEIDKQNKITKKRIQAHGLWLVSKSKCLREIIIAAAIVG